MFKVYYKVIRNLKAENEILQQKITALNIKASDKDFFNKLEKRDLLLFKINSNLKKINYMENGNGYLGDSDTNIKIN